MEPMKGKRASSRVDVDYIELFCIPEMTAVFISSCDSGLGDSGVPSRTLRLPTCLIGNTELLCTQFRGFGPQVPPMGMSRGISRVAAGNWGIFLSYSLYGHSKLHFAQRSQDSCLVTSHASGI